MNKGAEIEWTERQLAEARIDDLDDCYAFLNAALWGAVKETEEDSEEFIIESSPGNIEERWDAVKSVVKYKVFGPPDWVEEFKMKFMKVAMLPR